MHNSPLGYGLSELRYYISGTSNKRHFTGGTGPPTWPATGSFAQVIEDPPEDSVKPYASWKGQQNATFKNSRTAGSIGAEAVTIALTFPPKSAEIFLKTNLS